MRDIIIVGAGLGGSAVAYYLARHGLDILLLDKADFPRDKTCGDGLTPRALLVLQEMGLLDELRRVGCQANGLKIVAPKGQIVDASFPGKNGQPDYSLVVPRLILDDTVRRHALAAGAAFESPFRVADVTTNPEGVTVSGKYRERNTSLKARLVIIANGGASLPLLLRIGLLKQTPPLAIAARTYFEGVKGLTDQIQLRFDGVPLPGYGWIFPLSDGAANIGAGIFPSWRLWRRTSSTARAAYEAFIQAPALREMLKEAHQVGPVKGYPLRIDFATAPTYSERILLVGEAAGLVNPLTGEGIDYALESGKLAAEHIISLFSRGDFSASALSNYDQLLRQRFQRLFIVCSWVQNLFVNPLLLDTMVKAAIRRPDLKMTLINLVFGQASLEHMTLQRIARRVFNL